ncbi:hypothetical protein NDU88_005267 [Pleurodeles waltl]|uniref:Uncharacterized protein n=1 Tax=Pleurodeles waltl TaxID=8319 RepID=A0AAV7TC41_PLEWA|nr:hypothetical protein NDU88_005267 [Pleurodeles waltl]
MSSESFPGEGLPGDPSHPPKEPLSGTTTPDQVRLLPLLGLPPRVLHELYSGAPGLGPRPRLHAPRPALLRLTPRGQAYYVSLPARTTLGSSTSGFSRSPFCFCCYSHRWADPGSTLASSADHRLYLQDDGGINPKQGPDTHVVSPAQTSSALGHAGSGSGSRIALGLSWSRHRTALRGRRGSRLGRTQGDARRCWWLRGVLDTQRHRHCLVCNKYLWEFVGHNPDLALEFVLKSSLLLQP